MTVRVLEKTVAMIQAHGMMYKVVVTVGATIGQLELGVDGRYVEDPGEIPQPRGQSDQGDAGNSWGGGNIPWWLRQWKTRDYTP